MLRKSLRLALTESELARDQRCFHIGGFDDEKLVAVLLLEPLDRETIQMRQMAVQQEHQNRGIGSQLIA